MRRRTFLQRSGGLLLASGQPPAVPALSKDNAFPENNSAGSWSAVPSALSIFEWHKTVARPRSSPGLTNWCMIAQSPTTKHVLLSFCEITDPTGRYTADAPRMDFSGLARIQRFLISKDRGESWQQWVEHSVPEMPGTWALNGSWHQMMFLPDGSLLGFINEHTENGLHPMLFSSISKDEGRTWTEWRPLTQAKSTGLYAGAPCRLRDGRIFFFVELFDRTLRPRLKRRIRRNPEVWLESAIGPRRFGCAVSEDNGATWQYRRELDISMEGALNAGEPFEPAVTQLLNGDLLVVVRRHRLPNFGGVGLPWQQWILRLEGSGFRVVSTNPCNADVPLGHTGHPELLSTRDGIPLAVRSDGLWATLDGARFWERIESHYLGYYPRGVELDDGSILVAGHLGGDDYWPPEQDQCVRLTRLKLDRTPVLRNLGDRETLSFSLKKTQQSDSRVLARIGSEGSGGVVLRASEMGGRLSGYVFFVTSTQPGWLLGRMDAGRLVILSSGQLGAVNLTGVRPRLELAAVGEVIRGFINTHPVASVRDRTFETGSAGVIAEGGRTRIEQFELISPVDLSDIGGPNIELVRDLSAMGYSRELDNWRPL